MNRSVYNKEGFYAAFLFLVWPMLAAVSAIRNYNSPWAKNIFWAFCAFFGFTVAIGAESQGSDIVRYAARIEYLHGMEMGLADAIEYFMESGEVDFLNTLISVLVSRFTGSQAVLTLVYGTIFGYFLSRNMWYLFEQLEGKLLPVTIILLVCFFLVNPIWRLNGFRMWTATHIFLFGLLPYLLEGRRDRLWITVLSFTVHFSFLVPVGLFFSYLFLGNRLTLFFGFYLTTFFISELDISAFNSFVETYAPEILQERTSGYRNEGKVEEMRDDSMGSSKSWHAVWYGKALTWSIMGFLIILFVKGKTIIQQNRGWLNLYSFTLYYYAVANIFSSIPSGGRYTTIANLMALALIAIYVQNQPREITMKRFILIAIPALLLYIVVAARTGLYAMSATTAIGNLFFAFLTAGETISLNDVLKSII